MSIKFICSCGKRLKARDEMAGRRTACPRCGNPVGIPFLHPLTPGAPQPPMTPAERIARRLRTRNKSGADPEGQLATVPPQPGPDSIDAVIDRRTARVLAEHPEAAEALREGAVERLRQRRHGEMGTRWYHCLFYPVRTSILVIALSQALTYLTFIAAFLLPELFDLDTSLTKQLLSWTGLGLAGLVVGSYTLACLHCVLSSSIAGEVRLVHWPGRDFILVGKSMVAWLACFLSGPIVPAAAVYWFWFACGDPTILDMSIMAELALVAAGYWLIGIVSVARRDLLRDANPLRIADLAGELGIGPLLIILLGASLAVAHLYCGLLAVDELHRRIPVGLLWLTGCWLSGLYWATFLMRFLGLACHRRFKTLHQPEA
jgi:hypothetical protein